MILKIQGTIVSPDYDDEYFSAWIDRGIITPSSRVVAAIESATEPFDLYINSYGGDVFAGGEMMIALLKAAAEGKCRRCEVGSIAASMAANIVAALRAAGVDVEGHANSQLMFHGCYTETIGGAQHHEDVAASLRNVNEAVISSLNRIGITECRAWFAEGREKWLPADECKRCNLFTSIAETDATAPAEAKHTAARLAAFASHIQSRMEYQTMIDDTIKAEEAKPVEAEAAAVEAAPEAAPAVEEAKPAEPETPAAEPVEAEKPAEPVKSAAPSAEQIEAIRAEMTAKADERVAGIQSALNKQISAITKERDAALVDLASANDVIKTKDAVATSLQADITKLEADLAACRDQLAKTESALHEATVATALRPTDITTKRDEWKERYNACRRTY